MSTFFCQPEENSLPVEPVPSLAPWTIFLAICFLACLICIVFHPIVIAGFEFVESEVLLVVVQNPHIQGLTGENLKQIFTSRCITSYYPVRTLTYAIDCQVWGLNPAGFKLTNGLVHLANVLLVFWLALRFRRLRSSTARPSKPSWDVSVATFSAGIFAVHPVVVEPVAWIAGREELLMTLGALGCIHFHLTARRLSQGGGTTLRAVTCHSAAAVCCAAACLSNAVAAVIPLLIVALDALILVRRKWWRTVYGTVPLFAIGALTLFLKGPGHDVAAAGEIGLFSAKRLMLVLNVYWLNLKTIAWPRDLALTYEPLVPESFLRGEVIAGGIALGLTCVLLWKLRRTKLAILGVLWFGLALAPSLQIIPHHIHRADRFLYLPLVGLAIVLGAGLRRLGNASKPRWAVWGVIAVAVSCLFVLVTLSVRQVQTWRTSVSVWERCVSVSPNYCIPHRVLADSLAKRGQFDRAIAHYQIALDIEPDYVDALRNFASRLVTCEDEQLRDYDRAIKLAERGCQLTQGRDMGLRRILAMAYTSQASTLKHGEQFQSALRHYSKAVAADPSYEPALLNLAFLLATCIDEESRDPEKAVRLAEMACRLSNSPNPLRPSVLATAYAEAGRFDEAIAAAERALQMARAIGDRGLTEELQRQLKLYEDRNAHGNPADKSH